jgi:hypothetical protein
MGWAPVLLVATGCHHVRVSVDCRLARDTTLWRHLDGPRYAVHADDEEIEASLAFEESAQLLERALAAERPDLARAGARESADLHLTLRYNVFDRGTGVESYPVYGRSPGWGWRGGGYYGSGGYGVVGTHLETVHLGYAHLLSLSAWIPDSTRPADRQVVWEGRADLVAGSPNPRLAMPYLVTALAGFYGEATDRPALIKFDEDDERVESLLSPERPAIRPVP